MRSLIAQLLALILALGLGFIAEAKQKTLVIGVEDIDSFPEFAIHEGKFVGTGREILDAFAADREYTLIFRPMGVHALVEAMVKGEVDFKFPDSPAWDADSKSAVLVHYTRPITHTVGGAMVLPQNRGKTMEEIKTVGLVAGFTPVGWQERVRNQQTAIREYSDMMPLLKAGLLGDVDAIYGSIPATRHLLDKALRKPDALVFSPLLPFETTAYHLSTTTRPDVVGEFDAWLTSASPRLRTIKASHRNDVTDSAIAAAERLKLDGPERRWLLSHTELRVGVMNGLAPLSFATVGEEQGYIIDLINLLADRMGIDLTLLGGPSWEAVYSAMRDRQTDMIASAVAEAATPQRLLFTAPVLQAPYVMVGTDRKAFSDITQLKGKTIAVLRDSSAARWLTRQDGVTLLPCRDGQDCLRQIALQRANGWLERKIIADDVIAAAGGGFTLLFDVTAVDLSPAIAIGIDPEQGPLKTILDKALQQIAPSDLEGLSAKWFSPNRPGRVALEAMSAPVRVKSSLPWLLWPILFAVAAGGLWLVRRKR